MTDQRKDEMLNQGDYVVERLKDAANRMLDGEIIGHNLSVFATDILTIINRAAPPVPDDVAESSAELRKAIRYVSLFDEIIKDRCNKEVWRDIETLIRAATTPSTPTVSEEDKARALEYFNYHMVECDGVKLKACTIFSVDVRETIRTLLTASPKKGNAI